MASGRTSEELSGITKLGNRGVQYPTDYAPEVLETFVNKHPRSRLLCKIQLSGIYQPMSHNRTTGLCHHLYQLCA